MTAAVVGIAAFACGGSAGAQHMARRQCRVHLQALVKNVIQGVLECCHIAILKFKPDAKQADIDAYLEAFPGLMASQPTVRSWIFGRNEGAGGEIHVKKGNFAGNYDVGLTMVFDNPQGYLQYAESKGHQDLFAKYCTPVLAERVVVQFHED